MSYRDPIEPELLQAISLEAPRALIHRFADLVRESGTEAEWTAAREVASHLRKWGVPYTVHEPLLYLSVPEEASLEILEPESGTLRAKTPSFSVSTDGRPLRARVVYVSSGHGTAADTFDAPLDTAADVQGRIVLTEGFPSPQKVLTIQQRGASGIVFIHPGEEIHEMICTTIWGAPDLDSLPRKPSVPVVSVNRPDGDRLIRHAQDGALEVALHTRLREGWMRCPVVVAEIRGMEEPEVFLLAHGHIDSWHVQNCIAHMNIDSPGCRWATEYEDISWMPEAEAFAQAAIRDATGKPSFGERAHRAGDWSFNNLGLSGFFMLFSTMPKPLLEEKGYYPVGGCGANIAWHTEGDTLEVFDEANLARDLRAYATAVVRALNAPVHPLDFRATIRELRETLTTYQEAAGPHFDFSQALREADTLHGALDRFYAHAAELVSRPVSNPAVRAANHTLRRIGRQLVTLNFARADRFRHDPAVPVPPLPDLAPARQLASADPDMKGFIQAHLVRGQNRVIWTLRAAAQIAGGLE